MIHSVMSTCVCMHAPISRFLWPSITIRCINCHADKLWNVNLLTCIGKWMLLLSVQYSVHLYYTETNIIISWTNFHRVNGRYNNRWCRSIRNNDQHSTTCKATSYSASKGYTWFVLRREVSLPCSQQHAAGPFSEPNESSPHTLTYWIKIHLHIISSSPTHLKWAPCFSPKMLSMFRSSHTCYTHHLSHSHSVNRIIYSDWVVQYVWNVMAHARKPDFVFGRNGRVYLNRPGGVSSVDYWQPRCAYQR